MTEAPEPSPHLWLRAETKTGETRTPLTPDGARTLLDDGFRITVESMKARVFPDDAYRIAGCEIVPPGNWIQAPKHAWILGLKELPGTSAALSHTHIYFAHAFKGQTDAEATLRRFQAGNGTLLDLEYLIDSTGRRVAAFGYWAGYVGAALSLMAWAGTLSGVTLRQLHPYPSQQDLDDHIQRQLQASVGFDAARPLAIVIGALGRSGRGACACLQANGIPATRWDIEETARGGPFPEILQHEILVNCILLSGPTTPWVSLDELATKPPLRIIADVSCDPQHPHSPLPIYRQHSSLESPVLSVPNTEVGVISIDNLPSLLPKESSEDFAAQLLPHLRALPSRSGPWEECEATFSQALQTMT